MTPIEKAENALNRRISQLQANLRETKSETARPFLLQSLVVCIGIGEALTDYVRRIGQYAQGRHGELKPEHDTLTARHADLLKSGHELLERLKANPTEAYARAGYQAMLALELMTMAVSPTPPRTAEEAIHRAKESAAARVKAITARFTPS